MFFTFPEDASWNAEQQAVEFGVEIGEYRGVVRVPRRVFQRLPPEPPTPTVRRGVLPPADPVRKHRPAEATPTPVDRGRECRDQRARFALSRGWEIVPPAGRASQIDPKPTFPLFNPTGAQSPVGVDQSAFAP